MSQIKFTGRLAEDMQKLLASHDERAEDPGITAQYLSGIIGYLLAKQEMPMDQKESILQNLFQFSHNVLEDVERQRVVQKQAETQKMGVWKPGQ